MTIPLPHISDQTTNDAWSYRATQQINEDTARIDNLSLARPLITRSITATLPRFTSGSGFIVFNRTDHILANELVGGISNNFTLSDPITNPNTVPSTTSNNIVSPANGAGFYHMSYNIRVSDLATLTIIAVVVRAGENALAHTLTRHIVPVTGLVNINLPWSGIVELGNSEEITVFIEDAGTTNLPFNVETESDISLYKIT